MTSHNPPTADAAEKHPSPPRQTDEEVQRDGQDDIGRAASDVVGVSSLSRLERLPTELLSQIISYDHLSWHELNACSQTSRKPRQIALPHRGIVPALQIELEFDAWGDSWTVEVPSSHCLYRRSQQNPLLCAEVRRLEISLSMASAESLDAIEEWDPTFLSLGGVDRTMREGGYALVDARAEELINEYDLGRDGSYLQPMLRTYPQVRSLELIGLSSYQSALEGDGPEDLLQEVPLLRELAVEGPIDEEVAELYSRAGG
ncbi:hypothetical protein RTBOTA2_001568 [Rhodotorula toruloides]|nr:hypothetical protein RTBOTA2_001568 [Rhodotorula toruloides]